MREEDLIHLITAEVVAQLQREGQRQQAVVQGSTIPVALSNRHIHLSQEHVERLFGVGYTLTKLKDLSQPGQYAAKETVRLIGPKGILEDVRVLGPARGTTQIELAIADGFKLGIIPPIRQSGDLQGTPGCYVAGPSGVVELATGLIAALRHIHMAPGDALRFGVQDQELVKVRTKGLRALVFDQVLVRVSPDFCLEMHLDVEEGNAAGLKNGDQVEIVQ